MQTFYHVTSHDIAQSILNDGFLGGWGDAGFGVYFWDNLQSALEYADQGGWDGELDPAEAVIVMVDVDQLELENIVPDRDWPNPQDYVGVFWKRMDENLNSTWTPSRTLLDVRTTANKP